MSTERDRLIALAERSGGVPRGRAGPTPASALVMPIEALEAFAAALSQPHASEQEAAPRITEAEARVLNEAIRRYAMQEQKTAARKLIEALAAPHAAAPAQEQAALLDDAFDCAQVALLNFPDRASIRAIMGTLRSRIDAAPVQAAPTEPTCPACHGSGEGEAMEGRGPDTYTVTILCEECGGSGALATPAPVAAPVPVPPLQGAEVIESAAAACEEYASEMKGKQAEGAMECARRLRGNIHRLKAWAFQDRLAAPLHAVGGQGLTDEVCDDIAAAVRSVFGGMASTSDHAGWESMKLKARHLIRVAVAASGEPQLAAQIPADDDFECCGRPVVGAQYMGQQEMVCCGNPEPKGRAEPDQFWDDLTVDEMRTTTTEGATMDQDPRDMTTTELLHEFVYISNARRQYTPSDYPLTVAGLPPARIEAIEAEINRRIP